MGRRDSNSSSTTCYRYIRKWMSSNLDSGTSTPDRDRDGQLNVAPLLGNIIIVTC
jgi:hypothetical protein